MQYDYTDVYENQKWETEKTKQEAIFLKNANDLHKNKQLKLVGVRPKIKDAFFMGWVGNMQLLANLKKAELKVFLFLLDNIHFLNVVPINKVEVQKIFEIKDRKNFQKIYKNLIKKGFLINTNFSRKYLVVSPNFCFRGGKSELENISKIYNEIVNIDKKYAKKECSRSKYIESDLKDIEKLELELKKIFDEQYEKIMKMNEKSEEIF